MRFSHLRACTVAALACLLALPPVVTAQGRPLPADSAVLAIIRARVEARRSAGFVVGLLDADGRTRVVAFGDPGPGMPALDGNSVFEIGSISKVFTGITLAALADRGTVRLDDPVQKYLPAGVTMPARGAKAVTLASLAEQNSGLPYMPNNVRPANPMNPFADYSVRQLYDFLSGYTLTRDPGAQFEYSNLGVGLLGHTLSLAARTSYEQLARDVIWTPLRMTSTAITLTPDMTARLAPGHNAAGIVVPNWDLPTLAGAGAIRSTVNDMLRFLAANVRPERAGALGKAMALSHRARAAAGGPMTIGLNWIRSTAGADTIVWHNGETGGYRAFAGFDPVRKVAVVVLANTRNASVDDLGMHLLTPVVPLAPLVAAPKPRTAITLSESALAPFVGAYALTEAFVLDVQLVNGKLTVQAPNQPRFPMEAESPVDFFLQGVDAQITFTRDAAGVVTGLVLHQGGAHQPARKIRSP